MDKALDEAATIASNATNATGIALLQVSGRDPSPDESIEICMGNERLQDMTPEARKCFCGDTFGVAVAGCDMDKAMDEAATVASNATNGTVGIALLQVSGTDPSPDESIELCMGNERPL